MEITTDMLTLASAIVPHADEQLAQFFKIPLNDDGFFVEKHAKLGPCEFATDGVFLCGLAHYPKSIDEAISQGKAAASRAVTLLASGEYFHQWRSGLGGSANVLQLRRVCFHLPLFRTELYRRGCAHVCRSGDHQCRPVQGMRPVCGLLPIRRHSPVRIR